MFEENKTPRRWSLEEIDELLQDSGMLPREENSAEDVEEVAPTPKKAPFNPRPAYNENIKHNIITETVEKSDSVAEPQVYGSFVSEKYRDKFFNKPIQNLEKTAEHVLVPLEEQKYERGGFVKKKSNFAATADFTPVPHLVPDNKVSDDVSDKTMVFDDKKHTKTIALRSLAVTDGDAHDFEIEEEEDDVQLSLEGFHTEDDVEIVDERSVEEELERKRKEKVSSFTITSEIKEEEAKEEIKRYGTDEYRTTDDKYKVKYYLKKKKTSALMGIISGYIFTLALLLISLFTKDISFGGAGYIILSIAFAIVPVLFNIGNVVDGIKAIKGFRFNKNTGVFVALVACLIQCLVLLSTDAPFETGVSLFMASSVFALSLNATADYFEIKRIAENFEDVSSNENLYTINYIEKKETAFEIGRGLLLDEPEVISSQKTLFPRRFIELSQKYYPSNDISKTLIPISVGAALLVGAITLLVTKDIRNCITAFCGVVCVGVPYFAPLVECIAITKVCRKLRKNGAMLSGWQAYRLCDGANAVVLDSCDVFESNGGNVYGIHPFYDIQIDEAIIYTATLAIASGGPLGNLFKRVIVGETSLLPPVDTLAYEDKLGLSAWIFNRRILVGNADLLRNHNVDIPDTALITKHLKEGRYPLYLAIDGKAAAVFIISYDVDVKHSAYLRKIEEYSISLLIRSDDANITDEMVAEKVNINQSGVKILSAVSGDVYRSYVKETTTASDAVLTHDGKAGSFLYAIKSALSLGEAKQLLSTFQICAMGISLAVVAILSFVSGLQNLSCGAILLLQAFFTVVSILAVSGNHAIKSRNKKHKS